MRAHELFEFQGTEFTFDDLKKVLGNLGYKNIKQKTSKAILIFVPQAERMEALEKLKELPGAEFDKSKAARGESSIGRIFYQGFRLIIKPKGKQGVQSAGLQNEQTVIDKIKKFLRKKKPLNITFIAKNKNFNIGNVVDVEGVGLETAGRKKADIVFKTKSKKVPISIKKENAEQWESADSYYGPAAKKVIDNLVKNEHIILSDEGHYYSLFPEIAIHADRAEKKNVVFGSDLLGKGAVVEQTFTNEDFDFEKDKLNITASFIMNELEDVQGEHDVWFLVRNDASRQSPSLGYPGLRILAVYSTRVFGKKKLTLRVDANGKPTNMQELEELIRDRRSITLDRITTFLAKAFLRMNVNKFVRLVKQHTGKKIEWDATTEKFIVDDKEYAHQTVVRQFARNSVPTLRPDKIEKLANEFLDLDLEYDYENDDYLQQDVIKSKKEIEKTIET